MRIFKYIPIIGLLSIIASCDSYKSSDVDCSSYDYSDCYTSEPYDGRMYVKLTIDNENKNVPIAIYKGKLEDNDLYLRDTVTNEYYDTLLPLNDKSVYYTVTAQYLQNGISITAVDGDKISKYHTDICDSVCWEVNTGSVNVRLK